MQVKVPYDIAVKGFWDLVNILGDDECWPWMGSTNWGYGRYDVLYIDGVRWRKAHRISYRLSVGKIPEGLHILHSCDVRLCANYHHLRPGTNYQNIQDKMSRGRGPVGAANPASTITEDTARAVYAYPFDPSMNKTENRKLIAKVFNTTTDVVRNIREKRSWVHIHK